MKADKITAAITAAAGKVFKMKSKRNATKFVKASRIFGLYRRHL